MWNVSMQCDAEASVARRTRLVRASATFAVAILAITTSLAQTIGSNELPIVTSGGQRLFVSRDDCPSLTRFRDEALITMWDDAVRSQKKGKVFLEGRLQLRAMKREIEDNLPWAHTADGAYPIALVVKTTSDLIMDSLNVGLQGTPGQTLVIKTYLDVRRKLDDYANDKIIKAVRSAQPKVGAALEGMNVWRGNVQRITDMSRNGTLAGEMTKQMRLIDAALKANQTALTRELNAFDEVRALKDGIDRACGSAVQLPGPQLSQAPGPVARTPASENTVVVQPAPLVPTPAPPQPLPIPTPTPTPQVVAPPAVDPRSSRPTPLPPPAPPVATRTAQTSEQRIGSWYDPLTPPKGPKMTCVKEAKTNLPQCTTKWDSTGCSAGPIKYGCPVVRCENKEVSACVGHKYEWQNMRCDAFVQVSSQAAADYVKRAIESAAQEAAVKTAITQVLLALSSAGATTASAVAQFTAEFKSAVDRKFRDLPKDAMAGEAGVKLRQACGWTDWESKAQLGVFAPIAGGAVTLVGR
jgi:hypothetical protein